MKKILAIDDERDFTFMLKSNLEIGPDYEVIIANSGIEGIKAAKAHQPDIILLDIMMPGLDGLDTLKILKEEKSTFRIPVIMLTAKDDEESRMLAATMFDEGYMVKPVEIKALREKIASALNRHPKG